MSGSCDLGLVASHLSALPGVLGILGSVAITLHLLM